MSDLGIRALKIAEQEIGVHEDPPHSNSGPRIKEYLSKCERNGKKLGLTSGNWCASFSSWCAFNACGDDEAPPHLYRASVAELWKDAVKNGVAYPPTFKPKVGDLAIFIRNGHNPTKGEEGHVARLSIEPDENGHYETLDGNHNDSVCKVSHQIGPDLVGWISYSEITFLKPTIIEIS